MQRIGYIHGTGNALNVELGWIPDCVQIIDMSDGTSIITAFLGKVILFTSGGTTELKAGEWIKGITSGAKAKIREVILDSGTWAAGTAAGWLICNAEDITGTLTSGGENAQRYASEPGTAAAATDDITFTASGVAVEFGVEETSGALANVTGNAGVLSYTGDESNKYAKGFTVGATISDNGKLLAYVAMRNDPGEGQGPLVLGLPQSSLWA